LTEYQDVIVQIEDKNVLARRNLLKALGVGLAAGGLLLAGCKQDAAPVAAQPAAAPPPAPKPPAPAPEAAAAAAEPAPAAAPTAAGDAPAAAAPAEGLNCKDKAPIDDTSKSMRRALQYKEKSDTAGKACKGCAQFEAKKYGDCGGCKLITGAINPEGVCLSFAPLQAPAAVPN
jgi:hypothetical protein